MANIIYSGTETQNACDTGLTNDASLWNLICCATREAYCLPAASMGPILYGITSVDIEISMLELVIILAMTIPPGIPIHSFSEEF